MKISNKTYRMSKPAKRMLATIADSAKRNAMKKLIIAAEVMHSEKSRFIRTPTSGQED